MAAETTHRTLPGTDLRLSLVGVAGVVGLLAVTALGVTAGLWKLLIVGWVAFLAMAGAAVAGSRAARARDAYRLVWGYGLAAGAMVTSAAVFLLPQAFGLSPKVGGFGVAAGLLGGYVAHTAGHRLAHWDTPFDAAALEITAHALSAGLIIGVIYVTLPDPGLLLGLAIVSHKGPAGYAAARRLRHADKPVSVLLLPAAGVAIAAIPVAVLKPPFTPTVNAAVFGFAAGVFLHVAMDFLPYLTVGHDTSGHNHDVSTLPVENYDTLDFHAIASVAVGALAVFGAWLLVA